MAIGISESYNIEGQSEGKLEPGIYTGRFTGIKIGTKYNTQTKEEEPSFIVSFLTEDGKGHTENKAMPQTDEKAVSEFEKLLHMLAASISPEEQAKIRKMSFETMAEVVGYLSKIKISDSVLEVKVVGGVYNGNAFVRFPNFSAKYQVPFAGLKGSGLIRFSTNENRDNRAYYEKINGASNDTATAVQQSPANEYSL